MGNKITLIIFFIITTLLFVFFLNYPTSNSGGDIVEYFGMSESFISHGGVDLTDVDYNKLRKYLNAGYFTDPASTDQNGGFLYYMKGQDGRSYPVHFFFYSLLSVPVRLFLKFFYMDQLITLRLTNFKIFYKRVLSKTCFFDACISFTHHLFYYMARTGYLLH